MAIAIIGPILGMMSLLNKTEEITKVEVFFWQAACLLWILTAIYYKLI